MINPPSISLAIISFLWSSVFTSISLRSTQDVDLFSTAEGLSFRSGSLGRSYPAWFSSLAEFAPSVFKDALLLKFAVFSGSFCFLRFFFFFLSSSYPFAVGEVFVFPPPPPLNS